MLNSVTNEAAAQKYGEVVFDVAGSRQIEQARPMA
jgi:hypothetical protein